MTATHKKNLEFSVIMPVYNEDKTIESIVARVLDQSLVKELIIVDDASTDGSREIIKNLSEKYDKIIPIFHTKNSGKGSAIKSAASVASGAIVLIQDADLEYFPEDYRHIIERFQSEDYDVVLGSRFKRNRIDNIKMFKHRYLINAAITRFFNLVHRSRLTDVYTCYKAFKLDAFKGFVFKEKGFGFCIEVMAKSIKKGLIIDEVLVNYLPRNRKQGKKIKFIDGLRTFRWVLKYALLK